MGEWTTHAELDRLTERITEILQSGERQKAPGLALEGEPRHIARERPWLVRHRLIGALSFVLVAGVAVCRISDWDESEPIVFRRASADHDTRADRDAAAGIEGR